MRKSYQVQKEVAQKGCFEGEIALSELKRLVELLRLDDAGVDGRSIAIRFEFLRSEYEVPMVAGRLQTRLELECQRCLKPLELAMDADFRLLIDASDELLGNSSEDTIYSDDGYVDITAVVEDELILALPLVALHEDTACNENWRASELQAEPPVKENPFAVLQQLKTTD
ncbi:YceD family protein [Gammaproteobacteria bacterium]|nr:YceD family protein [Gammaproteobacteria bacterium]